MKRIIAVVLLSFSAVHLFGQETMNVFQPGGQVLEYPISTVDSVTYGSATGPLNIYHNGSISSQIPFSGIDSITFTANPVCNNGFQVGQIILHDTLSGSIKGTLQANKTYYFATPVTINRGDTLLMQSGVKLLSLNSNAQLIVKGSFISLGTKYCPNWITGVNQYNNPSAYKLTTPQNPNTDPALAPGIQNQWGGIQCDTSCALLVLKWTHIEFVGGYVGTTTPLTGYQVGDDLYGIIFQNPNGYFILEDNWIYGTTTDAVRVLGGKIHFMRNTIEKMAYNDGDALNVKGSTIGDMAYNLIIGTAKGGTKVSNRSVITFQTVINIYIIHISMVDGEALILTAEQILTLNKVQEANITTTL